MRSRIRCGDGKGFSLIEVLVALCLVVVLVASIAQLFAVATAANAAARNRTMAALLAEEKLEELRQLPFGFDPQGVPVTDTATDTTRDIATTGGTGLTPGGSVDASQAGFSDHIDPFGRRTDAAHAAFVRRWSIAPLPSNSANAIVIRVTVLRHQDQMPVHLVTVRTRKTR